MPISGEIRSLFLEYDASGFLTLTLCEPALAAFDNVAAPLPGQSAAVAFGNPRTAALVFDRIWAGVDPDMPHDVGFRTAGGLEAGLAFLSTFLVNANRTAEAGIDSPLYAELFGCLMSHLFPNIYFAEFAVDHLTKVVSDSIGADSGIAVVPLYRSVSQRARAYQAGDRSAIVATLENVPVISEDALSWRQVREVRRDTDVAGKLRKLSHWLDADMAGRPLSYIEDEISVRISDFEEATRKHGVETMLGTLQLTLEAPAILGGVAYLAKLGADVSGEWAVIIGSALAAAKVSAHLAKQLLDIRTQRATATGEIAYVIELRDRA